MDQFHVTRLEWAYITSPRFIAKVKAPGRVFGAAVSAALSHVCGGKDKTAYKNFACLNLDGEPVVPTWKRAWRPPGNLWMCVNNPRVMTAYMAYVKRCIDAGAQVMQRDEPGGNQNATGWGACFCTHCMKAFRDYLAAHTTQEERAKLGVADLAAFDYREHLKAQNAPVGDDFRRWKGRGLKDLFIQFQTQATVAFHKEARRRTDEHAGRRVPFSCNNGGHRWTDIELGFDWCFGELSYRHATPVRLHDAFQTATDHGRLQVVTMPKKSDYKDLDEWQHRTRCTIAMAYACGGHCMAPWDVYMPKDAPRYFGKPEQYADLYGFVRANARLFDGYEEAAAGGGGIPGPTGPAAPVSIVGYPDACAIVRVVPKEPNRGVVVHLVDWSAAPKPFTLVLSPALLFGDRPLKLRLVAPAPYRPAAHEAALRSGDYRELSVTTDLPGGYVSTVRVPALRPWGLLVIEPGEAQADGVWPPGMWPGGISLHRPTLRVRLSCPSRQATIHYTLDGSAPTRNSPVYTAPLPLTRTSTIKARAWLASGAASAISTATFTRKPDVPAPLLPDSAPVAAGLKLWLRADALADTLRDRAPVRTWIASAGPDATCPDARLISGSQAGPPTFRSQGIGAAPAIEFDGDDDVLSIKDFSNDHLAGKALTVIMVSQAEPGAFGICGNGFTGSGGDPRLYLSRTGYRYDVLNRPIPIRVAANQPAITTYMHDGTETTSAYLNGHLQGTLSGLPAVESFGGGHLAMPFWSGNRNQAGLIAEIVVFDRKLADQERRAIEAYLAAKYGIKGEVYWSR